MTHVVDGRVKQGKHICFVEKQARFKATNKNPSVFKISL